MSDDALTAETLRREQILDATNQAFAALNEATRALRDAKAAVLSDDEWPPEWARRDDEPYDPVLERKGPLVVRGSRWARGDTNLTVHCVVDGWVMASYDRCAPHCRRLGEFCRMFRLLETGDS